MSFDKAIEREIIEKGLTAPRITLAKVHSLIVGEDYHRFPGSTVTVCMLTLKNGYNTTGVSACASPENFDEEIGRKIAHDNAVKEIWSLEGYLLKEELNNPFRPVPGTYFGADQVIVVEADGSRKNYTCKEWYAMGRPSNRVTGVDLASETFGEIHTGQDNHVVQAGEVINEDGFVNTTKMTMDHGTECQPVGGYPKPVDTRLHGEARSYVDPHPSKSRW